MLIICLKIIKDLFLAFLYELLVKELMVILS